MAAIGSQMPEADRQTLLQNNNDELMKTATAACWKHQGAAMFNDAKAIVLANEIELQKIQLLVTTWQGTEDSVCRPATVEHLSKQCSNCTYKLLENEGHLLLLNQSKDILQIATLKK